MTPAAGHPAPVAHRPEAAHQATRALPGEPANQLAPGRAKVSPGGPGKPEPPKS